MVKQREESKKHGNWEQKGLERPKKAFHNMHFNEFDKFIDNGTLKEMQK